MSAEIRALMGRHRVSQTELARVCGMSQSSLSARLSGSVPWDVDDLDKVAEHFAVRVTDLFGGDLHYGQRRSTYEPTLQLVPQPAGQLTMPGLFPEPPRPRHLAAVSTTT